MTVPNRVVACHVSRQMLLQVFTARAPEARNSGMISSRSKLLCQAPKTILMRGEKSNFQYWQVPSSSFVYMYSTIFTTLIILYCSSDLLLHTLRPSMLSSLVRMVGQQLLPDASLGRILIGQQTLGRSQSFVRVNESP